MTATTIDDRSLDAFRRDLRGAVVVPGETSYDEARTLFNSMIDKRPAVFAQCVDAHDVARALRFAQDTGLEVAVRGGGHGVAGTALTDGGLVIDLRRMNGVLVDPQGRTARVGGGATMSDLDRATEPHGLATTGGRVSTTGVGGFTLGGGTGWLDRKLGFAADRLLAIDLVRADGTMLHASQTENPELFWALHGGGGNFGVATAFEFRLDPLPSVAIAFLVWPAESGPAVLRRYRDLIEAAPDEVGGAAVYLTGPPEEPFPPDMVGKLLFGVLVAYAGPAAEATPYVDPLLELSPSLQMVLEASYADFQCMFDDPPGYRNYWTAEHLTGLPDDAIDVLHAHASDMLVPSPTQLGLLHQGGKPSREGHGWPTPFRTDPWVVHPFGMWESPADDARGTQWAHDIRTDIAPWASGDVYLNFIGDEGEERVAAGFGEHYQRLARVKAEHDPSNVFHLNHNIKPAPTIPAPR